MANSSKTLFVELRKRKSSSRSGDKAYSSSCQVLMHVVVFVFAFDVWNSFPLNKLYSINEIVCSCRRSSALLHDRVAKRWNIFARRPVALSSSLETGEHRVSLLEVKQVKLCDVPVRLISTGCNSDPFEQQGSGKTLGILFVSPNGSCGNPGYHLCYSCYTALHFGPCSHEIQQWSRSKLQYQCESLQ